jgi:hypothetical protein
MIKIDLSYFYRLSLSFSPLRQIPENEPTANSWVTLYIAQIALQRIYSDDTIKSALRSSNVPANALFANLNQLTSRESSTTFDKYEKASLLQLLDAFEVVLQSDLAVADSFFVTDKAPFQTSTLIEFGETLFPPSVRVKCPSAIVDLQSAGKCLAFELATASGFHAMRALEAVLRKYWEVVTGNIPHPKHRNIGVYLNGLERVRCGDPKIIAALRQIKDLHRNEINHPDANLSLEEAISLIGMARSVASAMLSAIPDQTFELVPPPDAMTPLEA